MESEILLNRIKDHEYKINENIADSNGFNIKDLVSGYEEYKFGFYKNLIPRRKEYLDPFNTIRHLLFSHLYNLLNNEIKEKIKEGDINYSMAKECVKNNLENKNLYVNTAINSYKNVIFHLETLYISVSYFKYLIEKYKKFITDLESIDEYMFKNWVDKVIKESQFFDTKCDKTFKYNIIKNKFKEAINDQTYKSIFLFNDCYNQCFRFLKINRNNTPLEKEIQNIQLDCIERLNDNTDVIVVQNKEQSYKVINGKMRKQITKHEFEVILAGARVGINQSNYLTLFKPFKFELNMKVETTSGFNMKSEDNVNFIRSSLIVLAYHENRYKSMLISNLIYPQKNGIPQYNPKGKYYVKMFLNGFWRLIMLKDMKNIFWVTLLEKAYIKQVGNSISNFEFECYKFTGWIPEVLNLNTLEDKKIFKTKVLYSIYLNKINFLCGISSKDNNSYAVLDIKLNNEKDFFLLLQNASNHFWIKVDNMFQSFDKFVCLRNPKTYKHKYEIHNNSVSDTQFVVKSVPQLLTIFFTHHTGELYSGVFILSIRSTKNKKDIRAHKIGSDTILLNYLTTEYENLVSIDRNDDTFDPFSYTVQVYSSKSIQVLK
uniref:Calpain catalytic domain-containing protein n=1 Tax=viral metagenome TaxID=1070528 RepID=A0A6C0JT90_9ZZZZ